MPAPAHDPEHALLLLGRLDGRLVNSPATDIWLARARLKGAAALATLAGAPVTVCELQNWICGRAPPPRHSEGLNDPLSIAALAHFALAATDGDSDPVARATLNVSRTLLDDRKEAQLWGSADLVRFGPAWRAVQALVQAPYPAATLSALAERLVEAQQSLERSEADAEGHLLTTADGRRLRIGARRMDLGWVVACHLPAALQSSGLALRKLPSFVGLPRFIGADASTLRSSLTAMIARQARDGLADLDRLEARLRALPDLPDVTRRSKIPLLMRLELAYPDLSRTAVSRLLGISHQGATKLLAQAAALKQKA